MLMGTEGDMDDIVEAMGKIKEHAQELVQWAGKRNGNEGSEKT